MFVARKIPGAPRWQKDLPCLVKLGKDCSHHVRDWSSQVDPTTTQVMSEIGIDISDLTSKPLSDFNLPRLRCSDLPVAVGELARSGVQEKFFWRISIEDPEGQPARNFR